ncbi:MAG: PilN domain-containing protein [Phycisphaerales bacterium]|jgi:Tfp pilus assembly protein PilN
MSSKKSFLPEDYVRDARERRSGIFALALFVIVMGAVFSAFLVTNRQWAAVRAAQVSINDETEKAAKEIAEMKRLEAMRAQMVEKAELARGLIEPVPRSVLLACLVNTMPADLSLLEFEMKSEELKSGKQTGAQAKDAAKARRMTKAKEPEAPAKPEAVRRRVNIMVTGVAPDDLDVSRWMGALSRLPFLSGIRLEVSEEKEIRGIDMRQFKISMKLEPEADVRGWEGLKDLRTPVDPIDRGALEGAKIMTVAPEAPAKPAEAVAAPALTSENDEAAAGAQTAATEDPAMKEEVKP